ncbi:MAG: hypothetical protein JRI95_17130 [Deltaproteobacteria bacterium]|nr:hypothetical protein [Deltaproteobacteria bacterium]
MKKQMVECEDGRRRQARVYGIPKEEGDYEILQAGIRLKGKHVTGEAWHDLKTGGWYFFTGLDGKNVALLPRHGERPKEPSSSLLRSPSIRTE